MKKAFLLLVITVFVIDSSFAQGGVWTWISGDSTTSAPAVYGTQGVPSTNNHPQGFYEAADWKDKQGNFWLYGGMTTLSENYDDLWKFDPLTWEWTWVKGSGIGASSYAPVYGAIGISNPLNTPGSREWGTATWVDTSGNLWLFGGSQSVLNDLWMYAISTNEWTCVRGSGIGNYGTKGVPSMFNDPWGRQETASNWTDSLNNLWLFGGSGLANSTQVGSLNNLWKYNIATNEWTWMSGSDSSNAVGSYGIKGVSSPVNCPSGRLTYCKWKDAEENFYLMGGYASNAFLNDLWKYNIGVNEWIWINGSQIPSSGSYLQYCANDTLNIPAARSEQRSSTTDKCGRFWLFGGVIPSAETINDLWMFDPVSLLWKWLSGSDIPSQSGYYGILGVSSFLNMPPSRAGGNAWWGNDDRFYLFGGSEIGGVNSSSHSTGSMWMFIPDSSCLGACINLSSNFQSPLLDLCPGTCTNFTNLAFNATSYQWSFPFATPDTSTDVNPTNICYANPGTYDVQLIATNANGSDTLTLANYITVYPTPPPQSITQNGDTLFAIAGATSYQWYFNTNSINGATNYFYIAPASGDYNVVATDANGCEVEAAIFNVVAGLTPALSEGEGVMVFPNPVGEKLSVISYPLSGAAPQGVLRTTEISIYNMFGEKSYPAVDCQLRNVDCRLLPSGIYFLEIKTMDDKKTFRARFVKQ